MATRAGDIKTLLREVRKTPGWKVVSQSGHHRIYPPAMTLQRLEDLPDPDWRVEINGTGQLTAWPTPITMPTTPGSLRSDENRLSDLRKAGWTGVTRKPKRRSRPSPEQSLTPEQPPAPEQSLTPEPPEVSVATPASAPAEPEIVDRASLPGKPGIQELLVSGDPPALRYGCAEAGCAELIAEDLPAAEQHRRLRHANGADVLVTLGRRRAMSAQDQAKRLADALRRKIEDPEERKFKPGCQLPSFRLISERYDVSTMVVAQAIRLLEAQKLVVSIAREGVWVGGPPAKPAPAKPATPAVLPTPEPPAVKAAPAQPPKPAPPVAATPPAPSPRPAPPARQDVTAEDATAVWAAASASLAREGVSQARELLGQVEQCLAHLATSERNEESLRRQVATRDSEIERLRREAEAQTIKIAGLERRINHFRKAIAAELEE